MVHCDKARTWSRRLGCAALAALLLAPATHQAVAADGFPDFLSALFGGAQSEPQSRAPASTERARPARRWAARPLTVKLHRRQVARSAPVPTKPDKVSIFEDRTLRRGDAVMTRHGMRIFAGSTNWPYRDDDFVAISDAGRLDKTVQKTLVSLDSLPRR